jgi:hypothetical protein
MSTLSALQLYARAVGAIEDHIEANKAVFDDHKRLVMAELDARSNLEDEAALEAESIAKEPVLAAGFRVVAMPQTQEVWDEQKVLGGLNMSREEALAKGLLVVNQRPPRIVISKMKEAD